MAVLFVDSFDHYLTADITKKWDAVGFASQTITAAAGRNGTSGLVFIGEVNGGSPFAGKTLKTSPSTDTFIAGFAIKMQNALMAADVDVISVYDTAVKHISLRITTAGTLQIIRGDGTQLGSTSAALIAPNTYYFIEFMATVHNSAGIVQVRVNNGEVFNLTSQDTQNGGSGQWTGFRIADTPTPGTGARTYCTYDDLYAGDNTGSINTSFVGPSRVAVKRPSGAGASTDFTPSVGSNWQNVDDTTSDGDSTYNSEFTPGDHDTYTYGALGLTGSVKAIQTNLIVRSDGSAGETIAPMIRVGSTDYPGTTVGITTSYLDKRQVYETNPGTGVAWTVSDIDGAEFGIKLVS